MIKKLTCIIAFSFFIFEVTGNGQNTSQVSAVKKLETKVDAYVKPYMDIGSFNGTVLIARSGKVLLSKGYGMANYEFNVPNTPQTKFHLASISKTFTAAARFCFKILIYH